MKLVVGIEMSAALQYEASARMRGLAQIVEDEDAYDCREVMFAGDERRKDLMAPTWHFAAIVSCRVIPIALLVLLYTSSCYLPELMDVCCQKATAGRNVKLCFAEMKS